MVPVTLGIYNIFGFNIWRIYMSSTEQVTTNSSSLFSAGEKGSPLRITPDDLSTLYEYAQPYLKHAEGPALGLKWANNQYGVPPEIFNVLKKIVNAIIRQLAILKHDEKFHLSIVLLHLSNHLDQWRNGGKYPVLEDAVREKHVLMTLEAAKILINQYNSKLDINLIDLTNLEQYEEEDIFIISCWFHYYGKAARYNSMSFDERRPFMEASILIVKHLKAIGSSFCYLGIVETFELPIISELIKENKLGESASMIEDQLSRDLNDFHRIQASIRLGEVKMKDGDFETALKVVRIAKSISQKTGALANNCLVLEMKACASMGDENAVIIANELISSFESKENTQGVASWQVKQARDVVEKFEERNASTLSACY